MLPAWHLTPYMSFCGRDNEPFNLIGWGWCSSGWWEASLDRWNQSKFWSCGTWYLDMILWSFCLCLLLRLFPLGGTTCLLLQRLKLQRYANKYYIKIISAYLKHESSWFLSRPFSQICHQSRSCHFCDWFSSNAVSATKRDPLETILVIFGGAEKKLRMASCCGGIP